MRNVGAVTRRGIFNEIALCQSPKKRRDQETQIEESKDADLEELVIKEPYTIAKGIDKRQIRKPKRLIEKENLIVYAFINAEEEIKDLSPPHYIKFMKILVQINSMD
ncbi:hypothetical protein H5410_057845 [Solanum commersonii]|uniref:Uncharacterized protein n=1 Tax=Solanum commersonii TaxID=4109 RepID=A0A9J5WR61_SOLCO|nr:hypothetical protein H5410_057845 [Solanum commersonii]